MRFWEVTVYNSESQLEEVLHVAGDNSYRAAKIRRDLKNVHPEYDNIRLKRIKKPVGWTFFEDR
tara:strand:+ start:199 stop:390 length:192 start_codon:yes stop_codon:yes gene_type:complete